MRLAVALLLLLASLARGQTLLDTGAETKRALALEEDFVALAEVWAFVPKETAAVLHVGSDDGCRVSVNGRKVFENATSRPLALEQDSIEAKLRAGWNRITVKVENVGGPWGISLRVAGENGACPEGLRFSADAPPPRFD